MFEHPDFIVEAAVDGLRVVRLNRPDKLNAQTIHSMKAFQGLIDMIKDDAATRVVVLAAEGRGFCAGLELNDALAGVDNAEASVTDYYRLQETFAGVVQKLRALDKPVVAAVNGAAVGAGFALSLAADIRVASSRAAFHVGAIKIGLSAGECGISYHLPRIIGAARAFELMLTGRPIDAQEAERIGLVCDVVAPEDVLARAIEIARAIAANSPYAVKHTKQIMWTNLDAPSLDAALELENRTQILALMTEDFREAVAAFREKRKPVYSGK